MELTKATANSGSALDLPESLAPFGDVASTGGPASLTTLLCPLLIASVGIRVPKISATGSVAGAIDTLEIVPGFRGNLDDQQFLGALHRAGIAHSQQSDDLCPADRALVAERRRANMMVCPELACASLLGKKLVVAPTKATFDFRVGVVGNVGETFESARGAARLFYRVARPLNLGIVIVLTDDTRFPSSALGRYESLALLWKMVSGDALSPLDASHLEICLTIATEACKLAAGPRHDWPEQIRSALANGTVRKTLEAHLAEQGASSDALQRVLAEHAVRPKITVKAPANGFWTPPDLAFAKDWCKRASRTDPARGMRLLAQGGSRVTAGEPVLEVCTTEQIPPELVGIVGSVPAGAMQAPEVVDPAEA